MADASEPAAARPVDAVDEDGARWRKYGRKEILKKGEIPTERSYYRCSHDGCPARKRVTIDPNTGEANVTYEFEHTCGKNIDKVKLVTANAECGPVKKRRMAQSACEARVVNTNKRTKIARSPASAVPASGPAKKGRPPGRTSVHKSSKHLLALRKDLEKAQHRNEASSEVQSMTWRPDGVRNIRLFARVLSDNGETATLKPVRVMVSSQIELTKLRTQNAITNAELETERARVIALETSVKLLRSQLECRQLKAQLEADIMRPNTLCASSGLPVAVHDDLIGLAREDDMLEE